MADTDQANISAEAVDTGQEKESNGKNYEALAAEIGWIPKEKFHGNHDKWTDARTYYEKAEHVLPIVKKQREELRGELSKVKSQLQETREAMAEFQKFTEQAAERKVKDEIAKLKDVRAQAVAAGDDKAFRAADDAIDELREAPPAVKKPTIKPESDEPSAAFAEWRDRNPWYKKDAQKTKLADAYGVFLNQSAGLTGQELFEAVDEHMRLVEKGDSGIERPGPQRGGKATGTNSKAKTFENLLPEYKQAFAKFERSGMKITKEQYMSKCEPEAWGA
jgi:hypothetical protein